MEDAHNNKDKHSNDIEEHQVDVEEEEEEMNEHQRDAGNVDEFSAFGDDFRRFPSHIDTNEHQISDDDEHDGDTDNHTNHRGVWTSISNDNVDGFSSNGRRFVDNADDEDDEHDDGTDEERSIAATNLDVNVGGYQLLAEDYTDQQRAVPNFEDDNNDDESEDDNAATISNGKSELTIETSNTTATAPELLQEIDEEMIERALEITMSMDTTSATLNTTGSTAIVTTTKTASIRTSSKETKLEAERQRTRNAAHEYEANKLRQQALREFDERYQREMQASLPSTSSNFDLSDSKRKKQKKK
jgi:hypothetical protein